MGELDKVLRIVTAIHDAFLEPSAWSRALMLASDLLNSNGVVLALQDVMPVTMSDGLGQASARLPFSGGLVVMTPCAAGFTPKPDGSSRAS